jgi:hypothetical protein
MLQTLNVSLLNRKGNRRKRACRSGALRRLGACPTDDAARRAVERAVGTEEGAPW